MVAVESRDTFKWLLNYNLIRTEIRSPSKALDYWAVEGTKEAHGTFTQAERATVQDMSWQAISDSTD